MPPVIATAPHCSRKSTTSLTRPRAAEFFAGIGLVRLALEAEGWEVVFANDIDPNKLELYEANFDADHFSLGDVHALEPSVVPECELFTASFPCTDLSIAGAQSGLSGKGSGAFWGLIRMLREKADERPRLVMLENVVGFLQSDGGDDFEKALLALNELGYAVDAFILNAMHWTPQSRVRLFVVATLGEAPVGSALADGALRNGKAARNGMIASAKADPTFEVQPQVVEERFNRTDVILRESQREDPGLPPSAMMELWASENPIVAASEVRPEALTRFIYSHPEIRWRLRTLPPLPTLARTLTDILQDLPDDDPHWWNEKRTAYFMNQLSKRHELVAEQMIAGKTISYATAFRRVRKGRSMAELRIDGIAGCLRTPRGGSGRQILFKAGLGRRQVRLLTARECARLQGVKDDYRIDVPLNQALFGFGDAVCVPAIQWIVRNYLTPVLREMMASNTAISPAD